MDNSIYFYNIGFDRGSNVQPYFVSDMARDAYFSSLDSKQINKDGVNIKLEYDFYITIKANIDAVYMDEYNFAVVTYNERKYYCDIIDYEHISVNRSRVVLRRNMLYEITDYLTNFQDFMISRLNYNPSDFTISSALLPNFNFRYYNRYNEFQWKAYTGENVVFKDSFIFFINSDCGESGSSSASDYGYFVPRNVKGSNEAAISSRIQNEVRNIGCFLIPNDGSISYESFMKVFISNNSPYVISVQRIKFPYVNNGSVPLGFQSAHVTYKSSTGATSVSDCFKIVDGYPFANYTRDVWNFMTNFQLRADLSVTSYNKLSLLFGTAENRIDIDCYKYGSSDSFNITVELSILLDPDCSYYGVYIKSNSSISYIQNTPVEKAVFPINTSFSYPETTEAKWYAENKYYNAMTKNALRASIINGVLNAGENFATGGFQTGVAMRDEPWRRQFTKSTGKTTSSWKKMKFNQVSDSVMGGSNLIRGIFEVGHTINNAVELYNERQLQAENERAKPDSFSSGDITSSYYFSLDGGCAYILQIPFEEDLNEYINYTVEYGADVEMYRNTFNYEDFIDSNNRFILQAVAYKRLESKLTNAQYEELYEYLQAGLKYQVIGE